jgi:hypothetical protein
MSSYCKVPTYGGCSAFPVSYPGHEQAVIGRNDGEAGPVFIRYPDGQEEEAPNYWKAISRILRRVKPVSGFSG